MKLPAGLTTIGWQAAYRLAAVLLIALVLGLITGRMATSFALALGAYALFQNWNLSRVERWLRARRVEAPPDIAGPWGEVVAIVSRIYRRKQYHRARVTELLREFRRLTTAMPEGAVLLGPENEILWFNGRASEWLGLRRKRDVGIRIENLVRHPDFVEYLRTGEPESGVMVQEVGASGGRWFSFHVVRSNTGVRQLLIVSDVTREQHLESMRKDFVANASHELRSPLTVISGYLDALADEAKLDPAWNAPVLEMRRQAERMNTIINDLLELSKLESSTTPKDEQPVDIAGLLALLRRDALQPEHHPKNIHIDAQADVMLLGSESELHSVVSNLLSNAMKYTPEEGEIELRWWIDKEGAHVSVRDTGAGIPAEHIPRLTERFYRVDEGRARSLGGSGLGLAIVKHALQRHDATLQIKSREGVGSTFTCHFPSSRIVLRQQQAANI
jgi:two-component system, OmpR family, phosphate regulon sensor histidine kinase PhoR